MLFMFTEPSSPKIRDLRYDGRYALEDALLLATHNIVLWTLIGMVVAWWLLPKSLHNPSYLILKNVLFFFQVLYTVCKHLEISSRRL